MAGLAHLLSCKVCHYCTRSARLYVTHCGLHFNGPNSKFPCGVASCVRAFSSYFTFEKHFSEIHVKCRRTRNDWQLTAIAEHQPSYLCDIPHCHELCSDLKLFIVHLREHVKSNTAVNCPFENCSKKFEGVVESTFNSHISRYHKHSTRVCVKDVYISGREEIAQCSQLICDTENRSVADENENGLDVDDESIKLPIRSQMGPTIEAMLLKKTALFSLGLQVKHHVPSSTVQAVVSEFSDLINHNMTGVMETVGHILQTGDVTQDLAAQVQKALQSHPLSSTLDSQSGPMRSQFSRLSYYKKTFRYVQPVAMKLFDRGNPVRVYHYVPIAKTLQSLFKDANIHCNLKEFIAEPASCSTNSQLRDFDDGTVCKNDVFVKATPECVKLPHTHRLYA